MNISSAIKESLKIENGSQYTNYRVNNSIKNKIYQKISHNTSLLTDCTVRYTIVSMLPRLVLLLSYDMKNEQIRKTINISRCSVSQHIIAIKILNLSYFESLNGIFKASNQTHWNLVVEILIDQFSSWNYEKTTLELQTFQQLCSMTSAYLGKMCVHSLKLPFLKCNENAVFLFKSTNNKETSPFLFESNVICYVWWLPLFSKYSPGISI